MPESQTVPSTMQLGNLDACPAQPHCVNTDCPIPLQKGSSFKSMEMLQDAFGMQMVVSLTTAMLL